MVRRPAPPKRGAKSKKKAAPKKRAAKASAKTKTKTKTKTKVKAKTKAKAQAKPKTKVKARSSKVTAKTQAPKARRASRTSAPRTAKRPPAFAKAPNGDDRDEGYVYERNVRDIPRDQADESYPDQLVPGNTGEAKPARRSVTPHARDSGIENVTPEPGTERGGQTPSQGSVEHYNPDPVIDDDSQENQGDSAPGGGRQEH